MQLQGAATPSPGDNYPQEVRLVPCAVSWGKVVYS